MGTIDSSGLGVGSKFERCDEVDGEWEARGVHTLVTAGMLVARRSNPKQAPLHDKLNEAPLRTVRYSRYQPESNPRT